MKLVTWDAFALLPEGTIFSYYDMYVHMDGLCRKGETIWNRERSKPIDFFEGYCAAQCWNGEPPTVDDTESRWGLYDYTQQFAIYEPADLAVIVRMLGFEAKGST